LTNNEQIIWSFTFLPLCSIVYSRTASALAEADRREARMVERGIFRYEYTAQENDYRLTIINDFIKALSAKRCAKCTYSFIRSLYFDFVY